MCLVNFCDDRKLYDRTAVSPYGYRKSQRTRSLLADNTDVMRGFGERVTYRQLSLFDDFPNGGLV